MPKGKARIKDPRRLGPVAVAFVETLKRYGIKDVTWGMTRHGWCRFMIEGQLSAKVVFPCTPRASTHIVNLATAKLETEIMSVIARCA